MPVWTLIALTILADGLAGMTGALFSERWLARHQATLIGFAAGAMLAAVFLDLIPESLRSFGDGALVWTFSSFVAMAVVEWLAGHHHRKGARRRPATLPTPLLVSDALHNLGDGAAIAAAFLVSTHAGIGVAIAVVAHEVPQEVGDYAILRAAGWRRGRAVLALAAVQLTAALGALGVGLAAERFQRVTATALSLAAGTFLYIGATDLLPEIHSGGTRADRRERMLGFICGVAAIAFVEWVGAHLA
jgi:zinc and cadmium transporter